MRVVMNSNRRKRVLFVAALTAVPKGGHGGQLTAAVGLRNGKLAEEFDLVPLSSTMQSIPAPSLLVRGVAAVVRMAKFVATLPSVDALLVFTSDGWSLIEKGSMCAIARFAGKAVVIRFSSGLLPAQCDSSPAMRLWLRFVLRCAHVVVSQGPAWTKYFSSYPEASDKTAEIPNGVAVDLRPRLRTGEHRVVFVGWMHREKGIFELLSAAQSLRLRVPAVQFQFIGGGRDLAEFQAEVINRNLSDCVSARGWMSHPETLEALRSADVFALPSHLEGLPNALLEAMAAELPVVVTPVGSIPDVIVDGVNGAIVPVRDAPSLESALYRLLVDLHHARKLGAAAKASVIGTHGMDKASQSFIDAISRALRLADKNTRCRGMFRVSLK